MTAASTPADIDHSEIDPIALGIFASRTMAIGEEMGAHLGRAALSANIRDRRDYSCALFDAQGELVAQATHIPVHLGSMAYAMVDLARSRTWQPGDVMILNDPYQGGTHLPDVTMIQPVWQHCDDSDVGELIGFTACRAHYADIGAGETGSMGIATHLTQEGVLIPPSLLYAAGTYQEQAVASLLARVRDSALVHGDIRAQLSTCALGAQRMQALCAEMGHEQWSAYLLAMQAYAQRLAEAAVADIPDGIYHFADVLDDDGQSDEAVPIRAELTVEKAHMHVRFDAAPMVAGNLNCPTSVTAAAVYYVLRCLLPEHTPVCAGALKPVTFGVNPRSLLNAESPAAVALGNVETSSRVVDVLLGALAQALPQRIPAASQGTMNNLAMASKAQLNTKQDKQPWSYYETLAGGCGASALGHGADVQHSHMTNTLNTPVEILERLYPMRIQRYAQRKGSGGEGLHAGGEGIIREYEFLAPARVAVLTERRRYAPWGLAGGGAGAMGENRLNGQMLPGKAEFDVTVGDVLSIATPGGGAFGAEE